MWTAIILGLAGGVPALIGAISLARRQRRQQEAELAKERCRHKK